MSNCLTIIVTEFKSLGPHRESTYGFTAGDSYGKHYEDGWPHLSDFLQDFPDADTLIAHVKSCMDIDDDTVSMIDCQFPE